MILDTVELGGNRIPVIGSIEFVITKGEGAYTINYSVGLRTPIPTTSSVRSGGPDSGQTVNVSISYQDILHSGEVRCEPDKPVTVFKSGDKSLILTVSEP